MLLRDAGACGCGAAPPACCAIAISLCLRLLQHSARALPDSSRNSSFASSLPRHSACPVHLILVNFTRRCARDRRTRVRSPGHQSGCALGRGAAGGVGGGPVQSQGACEILPTGGHGPERAAWLSAHGERDIDRRGAGPAPSNPEVCVCVCARARCRVLGLGPVKEPHETRGKTC